MSVGDTPNFPTNLLPAEPLQADLFICDVADAVFKELNAFLEHPFYALSKKPPTTVRRYENGEKWVEITPSVKGQATIYDKDILIYAISQLIAKLNRGEPISKRVRINSRECLEFIQRDTGGKDYKALIAALDRLEGTRIRTNVITGDEETIEGFGLIDASSVKRKYGLNGRLLYCDIILSQWVFNAIENAEVLTLSPQYFQLSSPTEKRIYELARKHCGQDSSKKMYVETLFRKSGATGVDLRNKEPERYSNALRYFRHKVKKIIEDDQLPDYSLEYLSEIDQVIFLNRDTMPKCRPINDPTVGQILASLDPDIDEKARKIAIGWDIHHVRDCFAAWWVKIGKPDTANPDALFLKFCHTWQDKNGQPM